MFCSIFREVGYASKFRRCYDRRTEGNVAASLAEIRDRAQQLRHRLGPRFCGSRLRIARTCSRATPAVLASSRCPYSFAAWHPGVYSLGAFLVSAVFDLRLGVVAEIKLLLPAIGVLPDTPHPGPREHAGARLVRSRYSPVEKFGLWMEVIIGERLRVGLHPIDDTGAPVSRSKRISAARPGREL
jgi:hypothetical protein